MKGEDAFASLEDWHDEPSLDDAETFSPLYQSVDVGYVGTRIEQNEELSYNEPDFADVARLWRDLLRVVMWRFPALSWHDAEDVVQDAVVDAWERRAEYVEQGNLFGWLATKAYYRALALVNWRRSKHFVSDDVLDFDDADMAPDSFAVVSAREQLTLVVAAVDAIRPYRSGQDVRPMLERAALGDTQAEIAERCGATIKDVNNRLLWARKQARAAIA